MQHKLKYNLPLILWFEFFSWFIFSSPILILFFNYVLNDYALSMSLFAVRTLICSCLEIPIGVISDKLGRKKIMIFGALSKTASFMLYACAADYTVLFFGSVFYGLSSALSSGNNDALLYDTLRLLHHKQDFHKYYAQKRSYRQLGLFLGSLLGGIIGFYSLRWAMILSVPPLIIAGILTFRITEPRSQPQKTEVFYRHLWGALKELWQNKRLRYLSLAESLHYGFNEASFHFNSVFIKMFVPVWSLGIFRAAGHLFDSFGASLSRRFVQKFGLDKVAAWGYIADNAANIISVLAASILTPFIRLLSSAAEGVRDPVVNTIIQDNIPNTHRATGLSVISILSSLTYSICAVFVGLLADMTSPFYALLTAYTIGLLSNGLSFAAINFPDKTK